MNKSAFTVQPDGTLAVWQRQDDVLDYGIDYAKLIDDGDAIVNSEWLSVGVTLSSPGQHGALVSVFVGGAGGSVTNTVTTAKGRRKTTVFAVLPAVHP